jgi:hypothetical protein
MSEANLLSIELKEVAARIKANNTRLGWYDQDHSFPAYLMMMVSEVSEALEAWRNWGFDDVTYDKQGHPGSDPKLYPDERGNFLSKPEGVGSEMADLFIRLIDDCYNLYDIDLVAEVMRKMQFNETRPHRHGGKPI